MSLEKTDLDKEIQEARMKLREARINSWLRPVAWIASLAAAGYLLFSILRVGLSFALYVYVNDWVTRTLGLDAPLAFPASIALTALAVAGIPSVLWYATLGRRAPQATGIALGFAAVSGLLMVTIGQNVFFDRVTGKPVVFYVKAPDDRIILSRTPGFDPTYGLQYQPITKEIAAAIGESGKFIWGAHNLVPHNREITVANISVPIKYREDTVVTVTKISRYITVEHCNNSLRVYEVPRERVSLVYPIRGSDYKEQRDIIADGYLLFSDRATAKFQLTGSTNLKPNECKSFTIWTDGSDGLLDKGTVLYIPAAGVKVKVGDVAKSFQYSSE